MCTETFLRLPEEKRSRFLDAAWEEFTTVPYADVSINKIIHRAGIPRGSFYQYFTGKDDLFAYLVDQIRDHLSKAYAKRVIRCGGDLFQTQLLCYDQFVRRGSEDLAFGRCLQILRLNSGLHLQIMWDRPECSIFDAIREHLDLTAFQRQDEEYLRQVVLMALLALAAAVKDTLDDPSRAKRCRQELQIRLEILRLGTCAEPCEHSPKEAVYI